MTEQPKLNPENVGIDTTETLNRIEQSVSLGFLTEEQKISVVSSVQSDIAQILSQPVDELSFMRDVWDRHAQLVDNTLWKEDRFNAAHMEANKLYAASLFDLFSQREVHNETDNHFIHAVYDAYFSSSDSITSFTGGLADSIELYARSQQSRTGRSFSQSLTAGLVYDGTFSDAYSGISSGWTSQQTAESQLAYLGGLNKLHSAAQNEMYDTHRLTKGIDTFLEDVASKAEGVPPFVRLTAQSALEEGAARAEEEWVWLEELPNDEQESLLQRHEEYKSQAAQEQILLHTAFPQIDQQALLYRISRDACAVVHGGSLMAVYSTDGRITNLDAPNDKNDFALDRSDITRLFVAHDSLVTTSIEHEAGLDIRQLSLAAQLRLFEFMSEADSSQYERLCGVLNQANTRNRIAIAESFLAAEFGDDYADSILSIAEKLGPHQVHEVFENINSFRTRTKEFADWFRPYDSDFAQATEMAMNERLTDALYALESLAVRGSLNVDVAPHRNTPDYQSDGRFMLRVANVEEGMEILGNLEKSLGLMHNVVTAKDVQVHRVNETNTQFIMYRFTSQASGQALLYIRPEGAKGYDKAYEYGNRHGVEASLSFIVNPTNAHHLRSDKDPDGVSIRFDREGRMLDDSPFAVDRDPTKAGGTISVDISSGMGDSSRMPVKIGRFIAAGNLLRAQRTGSHESLHHNTNYFDQKRYGNNGGFAKLAIYTAHMAEAMIRLQEHGNHGSKYRRLPGVLGKASLGVAA